MPGITLVRYRSELSVATKSSKQPPLDTSGSDLGQLPYCYMRPSAKLAVKPINWSLRSKLNRAPKHLQ
jgi:hypothetical protein